MKKFIFLYLFALCQVLALKAQTNNITNANAKLSAASITVSPSEIITDKFTINGNYTTFAKTIKVTGTNLLSDSISVKGVNLINYKVSKDSINFEQLNFNLPKEGGKVWIKAITNIKADYSYSDTLQLVSGTILYKIPIAKQELLAKPFIKGPTYSSLENFTTYAGIPSDAQSFSFYGDDLQGPIKISVHPPYKLSKINNDWTDFKDTVLYFNPNSSGSVFDSLVYVRLIAANIEIVAKNEITLSSKYATNKVITIDTSYVLGSPPSLKVLINDKETDTFETFRDTVSLSVHPQKLHIIGKNLTSDATLQLPSSYVLCDDTGAFIADSYLNLPLTKDSINTICWIRLNDGEATKTKNDTIGIKTGENGVVISSNGTSDFNTVYLNIPESYIFSKTTFLSSIKISKETLDKFTTTNGTPSAPQYFVITSSNLSNSLTIAPPSNYQVGFKNIDTAYNISLITIKIHNNINQKDTIWIRISNIATSNNGLLKKDSIDIKIDSKVIMNVIIPEGKLIYKPIVEYSDSIFYTNINTPSKFQYFTIQNFNATISVNALPDFELSLDKTTFKNPLPLPTYTSLKTDTVWVRLAASNTAKTIPVSTLLITGDVDTVSINLLESYILDNISLVTGSKFETFKTTKGTPSKSQKFNIKGGNLVSEVLIECDYGFEIRKTNESWSNLNSMKYDFNSTIDQEFEIRINETGNLDNYENTIFNNDHFISQPNTNHIIIKTQNNVDIYLPLEYDVQNIITTFDTTLTDIINIGDKINIYPDTINYVIDKVNFNYRATNAPMFRAKIIEKDNFDKYYFHVDSLPIGIEYYVITQYHYFNQEDNIFNDTSATFYKYYPLQKYINTPLLKKGNTVAAYQFLSFPFDVTNTSLATYLDSTLGIYNAKNWRLFKFNTISNQYIEYPYINKIENGEGYMLIARNGGQLPTYTAKPLYVNQANPFQMNLKAGWNLIGNPYNFIVDWDDVKNANLGKGIKQFRVLNNGNYSDGVNLEPFVGGFVYVDNDVIITIPAQNKQLTLRKAQRISGETSRTIAVSEQDWEVNFKVMQSDVQNNFVGIGMHPEADTAFDEMDDEAMPHFIEYADFYTKHNGKRNLHLSKDVTSPQTNKTWCYTFETNNTSESVTILWQSPVGLSNNIYLVDNSNKKVVSLKENSSYTFTPSFQHQDFKFLYGDENYVNQNIDFESSSILSVAPNPTATISTINYFIAKSDVEAEANIAVKDVNGTQKLLIPILNYEGYNTQKLDLSNLPSGVYLVELRVANEISVQKIIKQ